MEGIRKFKFGRLFFLIGHGGAATYLIKNVAKVNKVHSHNIITYHISNLSEIESLDSSPFVNNIIVANLDPQYKLDLSNFYTPDANSIIFVQLSFFWKDYKKIKDSVESLTSEFIELIDLTKYNWFRQTEFKTWYNSLDEEEQSAVQQYKDNPLILEDIMNNDRVRECIKKQDCLPLGFNLLEVLGSKEAIKLAFDLPLSECHKFWHNRNYNNTPAYLFLAGGPTSPKSKPLLKSHLGDWTDYIYSLKFDTYNYVLTITSGKCPLLWYYYDLLVHKKLKINKDYSAKDLLILFVFWLVLCNNITDKWKTGLTKKVNRKGNSYYIFKPHPSATNLIH